MSLRKRGEKWQATVYLIQKDGKRKRISKTFSKKSDAKRWEKENSLAKEEIVEDLNTSDILLPAYVDQYLYELKNSASRGNTYTNYKSDLTGKNKLSEYFHRTPMKRINAKKIREYTDHLIGLGLAAATVNRNLASVQSFFRWATHSEFAVLNKDPSVKLKKLEIIETDDFKYFEADELKLFLEVIEDHPYKDFFIFLLNTGLRISEGVSLTVGDFYALNGVLNVHRQLSSYIAKDKFNEPEIENAFVFGPIKGGLPRKLALNFLACEIVARHCKGKKKDDFIFEPKRKREADLRRVIYKRGAKPTTKERYCLNANNFYKTHFKKKVIDRHGFTNIGLHGLRHTFGANFMMNGGDLYELKNILGHKSIENTQKYAHLSPKYLAESKNIVVIGE